MHMTNGEPRVDGQVRNMMNNTLILSGTSAMTIAWESAKHDGLETGGLLLGRKLPDNVFLVLQATNGGPNAKRSRSSFSPDTEYLNRCIERAERAGILFLGQWHLHPGSISKPSGGDERTIEQTIATSNLDYFAALIVNVDGDGSPKLYAYDYASKTRPGSLQAVIMDDKEANSLMPWFYTKIGQRKLLLDSKSMAARFRDFKLHKKDDKIFWTGEYMNHQILLLYPMDFPKMSMSIAIKPNVPKLPDEPEIAYAVLAAEVAHMRIDQSRLEPMQNTPVVEADNKSLRPWYVTESGKQELQKIDTLLRAMFPVVTTLKLADGNLALKCSLDQPLGRHIVVLFPPQYPDVQPDIHAYADGHEVKLKDYPASEWQNKRSVESVIKHAISNLRAMKL